MAESASYSAGIASRYATAVFEIGRDGGELDAVANNLDQIAGALDESAELRELISSPVYTRDQQLGAVSALASAMGLSGTMTNTLRLMAQKRRLFVLPQFIAAVKSQIEAHRGEITAEVVSAEPLSADQEKQLAETLKANIGKTVKLATSVDESLIGGLVVRVGSRMIDTSIRSKLDALQNAMKEAR